MVLGIVFQCDTMWILCPLHTCSWSYICKDQRIQHKLGDFSIDCKIEEKKVALKMLIKNVKTLITKVYTTIGGINPFEHHGNCLQPPFCYL